MQEMQSLLPDMTTKWHRLPPDVFQAIIKDPEATVAKLVQLKAWFPQANISLVVSCRQVIYATHNHLIRMPQIRLP